MTSLKLVADTPLRQLTPTPTLTTLTLLTLTLNHNFFCTNNAPFAAMIAMFKDVSYFPCFEHR